ncbi:sulfite exporter TauE/SafE family protein [Ramlibacter sp. RBP-2]|uniref:Sulfite exporter TauE/SafE family protein n=1 Tax=Ramlibacter lithotrophicus TaxID=2606681 RepID=A0A7X6DEF7_9BURK|nr:sulfite exporter TauE/SafE family protein [Ramlibacter lithotrophicus]NKE65684.1 sulfite exporter TauE/SafE family protein [Ramlibacter lithotrophicus]
MSFALAFSALLMGLAGGPHCIAMCGAACAGLTRAGRGTPARSMWAFHAGRLAGYSAAGAAAALTVQSLGWLTSNMAALRPVWTLFHLAVLAWGLMLVALARQPMWVSNAGRSVWTRVRPMATARGGVFATGTLWALMPCGLLYSALLVASLSGGPLEGAAAMALFALGSGLSLALAPALLARLAQWGNRFRQDWGTRAAGALLVAVAGWALWMDMSHRIAMWCAT